MDPQIAIDTLYQQKTGEKEKRKKEREETGQSSHESSP